MHASETTNGRSGLAWLLLGLLACLQSGCAMCANDFDCFYGAYGGAVCRDDMVCGRLNSVIRPASGNGSDCGPNGCGSHVCGPVDEGYVGGGDYVEGPSINGEYIDGQPYDGQPYPLDESYDSFDGSGSVLPDGEYVVPGSERMIPANGGYDGSSVPTEQTPMPLHGGQGVEATSYEDDYDEYDYSTDDPYGLDEQPVEVYEPDYGYDDDALVGYDEAPVGSGVPPQRSTSGNVLRGDSRSRSSVPRSLPRRISSVSSRMMPDDEFIEKLLPMSEPPRPGFLQPTPRDN